MELNRKNTKRIIILIVYTILLLAGVWRFNVILDVIGVVLSVLKPFIVGGVIAFILCQPMKFFERVVFRKEKTKKAWVKKISRPLSILLSILFILGVVLFVCLIIIPEVGNTIGLLVETIPEFVDRVRDWVMKMLEKYPSISEYMNEVTFDWNKISDTLLNMTSGLANGVINSASAIVGGIVSTVTNFVIGFVFAIYLLASKEKLSTQAKKLLYSLFPRKRVDRLLQIAQLTNTTFARYLSGQCAEAVILGAMFFVTLSILRYPYALLIGVLVAFTALIPILGAYIGSAISVFLIFMVDPIKALWFIVIFNVLQQIEGNFIYPHVVGGSVGLPSLWVLFAVTIGGSLMGIAGMIIFIPLISVIYATLRENVNLRLMIRRVPEEKWKNT